MKRPLKAREVALVLLPALALGGFGWYQWRVETSGKRGMFVSSVQLLLETRGSYQATGMTHRLTVTIDHPWPRPRWWGKAYTRDVTINALSSDEQLNHLILGARKEDCLMSGYALTTTASAHKEFSVEGATNWATAGIFSDGHYVFTSELPLAKVSAKEGAVTFHGTYFIWGQKPIRVTRVVRKTGEVIVFKPDRNPNGRIVSTKTNPFSKRGSTGGQATSITSWVVERAIGKPDNATIVMNNIQLRDGSGRVFKIYSTRGCEFSVGVAQDAPDPNVQQPFVEIGLSPKLKTTNPLTLSGTISIDDGWPIPFSVRLPPR